jgi:sulfate adenylyltransferase subunit 2
MSTNISAIQDKIGQFPRELEDESIYIMREVAGQCRNPALLFSGGKDSICLLRLAEKAFRPSDLPMPFLNVETGHEFPELIEFLAAP